MDKIALAREARKQRRLETLGTNQPRCGLCGETDWRCMELDHVAGQRHDDATVILCRNCHRKKSDDQRDHPAFDPNADSFLDQVGHFLLGLADLLRLVIEKLTAFGQALIERPAPKAESATQ